MSDWTSVTTGYNSANPSSGVGGRTREQKVMDTVDAASSGSTPASSANSSSAASTPAKASSKPASFAPSPAVSSHVYGAPVSTPILKGGQ